MIDWGVYQMMVLTSFFLVDLRIEKAANLTKKNNKINDYRHAMPLSLSKYPRILCSSNGLSRRA